MKHSAASFDRRTFVLLGAASALGACGGRGQFVPADPSQRMLTRHILYASNIQRDANAPYGAGRGTALSFALLNIATPPDRKAGKMAFTGAEAFTLAGQSQVQPGALRSALEATVQRGAGRTDRLMLWVHGFNNTPAEAVYRQVQIVQDVGHAGSAVSFVWPSAASTGGYIHDRDSVLQARDALAALLIQLRAAWHGQIMVIAHSLGAFLTMEALGRLRMSGRATPPVDGLILVQPDIAPEVFEAQVRSASPLPSRSALIVSSDDPVLRLSARLSGDPERVGATVDIARYEDLGLRVIDLTSINDAVNSHMVAFTSETVLQLLRGFLAA